MIEADYFLEETRALAGTIQAGNLPFSEPTLFKDWTTDQILRHLHFWNGAARLSLEDAGGFAQLLETSFPKMAAGGLRAFEDEHLNGLSGQNLLSFWLEEAEATANTFKRADPEQRLPWAGPPMSARSSISARLMETWAHGQAIYDALGQDRRNEDRIFPIAELGVRTFGWTFTVQGVKKPDTKPYVRLTAPSGAIWTFNNERSDERIEGPAEAFCQVVTQTRNIADVNLTIRGPIAAAWMAKAQCFAGGAESPPPPGLRRKVENRDVQK